MDKTELINKLLWLGYTSAEEGTEKRKEAVNMAHNLLDEYLEAINYTHCCKSDSELLNNEDLEIGEQVRITQTKLVEINYFREDGDIDVEDATRLYTVSLNEISKVV